MLRVDVALMTVHQRETVAVYTILVQANAYFSVRLFGMVYTRSLTSMDSYTDMPHVFECRLFSVSYGRFTNHLVIPVYKHCSFLFYVRGPPSAFVNMVYPAGYFRLLALGIFSPLPELSSFLVLCHCVMLVCQTRFVCSPQ